MKRTILFCVLAIGLVSMGAKPKRKLKNVDPIQGTVSSISVVTANGFGSVVANPTTNAAITLYTTLANGVVSSNGSGFAAAPMTGTGTVVLWNSPTITGTALFNLNRMTEQGTTATPASGSDLLYFKGDHNLYQKNPSGTETQIGGGGTGITSIDSDTTAAQTLSVGTTGTNFAIVDGGGGAHAFNLPDAGSTARGVVTTGTQTFNGNKTVAGTFTTTGTISGPAIVTNIGPSLAVVTNSNSQLVGNATVGTGSSVLSNGSVFGGTTTFSGTATAVTGFVEALTGHIIAPVAYTYILDQSAAYAYTINTLIVQTSTGTLTAAVKIGGTNVTGISAVSVSSSPATGTATAANSVAIGNQVTLVVSSPASTPADLSFTLKYTR